MAMCNVSEAACHTLTLMPFAMINWLLTLELNCTCSDYKAACLILPYVKAMFNDYRIKLYTVWLLGHMQ